MSLPVTWMYTKTNFPLLNPEDLRVFWTVRILWCFLILSLRYMKLKKKDVFQFSWSEGVIIYESYASISIIIWVKYKFMNAWKNRGERTIFTMIKFLVCRRLQYVMMLRSILNKRVSYKKIIINKICIWLRIVQWKGFNSALRPKWKNWFLMDPNLFLWKVDF